MIRAVLFDLDGTLYRGADVLPGAPETVRTLRERGLAIRFITNNSGATLADLHTKLTKMGFDPDPGEIMNSGMGAAAWCDKFGQRSVFVVGERGLVATFRQSGLTVLNAVEDGVVTPQCDLRPDAVVVGICRSFTYDLMAAAMTHIRAGAQFVATNLDATFPMEGNRLDPGSGSIVRAIATCAEREPHVIGKPNPDLLILSLFGTDILPAEALVVGDRLDSDILAGERGGFPTHLVLTGVTAAAPPGMSWSADVTSVPSVLSTFA